MKNEVKNTVENINSSNEKLLLSDVINSKILKDGKLLDRINKLVDFLDECESWTPGSKVSVGDILGYMCGKFDTTLEPVDVIETFD